MPSAAKVRSASRFTLLAALTASTAFAQDFSGFRIPEHRVLSWTGNASGDYQRTNNSNDFDDHRLRSAAGGFSSGLFWLADSDPVRSMLEVYGNASGRRDSRERHQLPPFDPQSSYDTRDRGRTTSELLTLAADQRRYPWAVPLGAELSGAASAAFYQSWPNNESVTRAGSNRTTSHADREEFQTTTSVQVSATLGYGRVRSATPVYEAWLLEERLRETGALTRPLSAEARRRLSEVLSLRGAYASAVERSARSIWSEVEKVLAEDDALDAEGLDAFSVIRAGDDFFGAQSGDGLPRSPIERSIGFFAGPLFMLRHDDSHRRATSTSSIEVVIDDTVASFTTFTSSQRMQFSRTSVLAGPRLEFHRPIGARWQIDAHSALLFPLRSEESGSEVTSLLGVSWMVSERWLATLKASQSRWIRNGSPQMVSQGSGWDVVVGGSVQYFLEDRFGIELRAVEQQSSWDRPGDDPSGPHNRSLRVQLGVAYTFTGRLIAPGLVAPLRTPRSLAH